VGVQVKLWNPLRTRSIPERLCGGDSVRRGAISSVCTFTFTFISYRIRDRWRFRSKIANFSCPGAFSAPLTGFPLEFCNGGRAVKTRMMP